MNQNRVKNLSALLALGMAMMLSSIIVPVQSTVADDLYATGIGSGKTKPLIDIENRLAPPKQQPVAENKTSSRKPIESDTNRIVEDANKYQLFIDPVFPKRARVAGKEGSVEVEITFDRNGKMKDARIRNCTMPGWGFEQAVLAACLDARLNGHGDREVTVKATLKFQLE